MNARFLAKLIRNLTIGAAIIACACPLLKAKEYVWTGDVSICWTAQEKGNWNPKGIPKAGDDVILNIDIPGKSRVSLFSDATIKSLRFTQTTSTLNWLQIGNNITFTVSDKILLNSKLETRGRDLVRLEIYGTGGKLVAKNGVEVGSRGMLMVSTLDKENAVMIGDLDICDGGEFGFYRLNNSSNGYGTFTLQGNMNFSNNARMRLWGNVDEKAGGNGDMFRQIRVSGDFTSNKSHLALSLKSPKKRDYFEGSSTSKFTITGGTLNLILSPDFDYTQEYSIFENFGAGGKVTALKITGHDARNWKAQLDKRGVLSFERLP